MIQTQSETSPEEFESVTETLNREAEEEPSTQIVSRRRLPESFLSIAYHKVQSFTGFLRWKRRSKRSKALVPEEDTVNEKEEDQVEQDVSVELWSLPTIEIKQDQFISAVRSRPKKPSSRK
ncbi:hypothetical protein MP638_000408 [Amoeboaphelidium occidentale]|nr:hypothetical protein MP638_000408 [Amoeboaphelidium occidentale]